MSRGAERRARSAARTHSSMSGTRDTAAPVGSAAHSGGSSSPISALGALPRSEMGSRSTEKIRLQTATWNNTVSAADRLGNARSLMEELTSVFPFAPYHQQELLMSKVRARARSRRERAHARARSHSLTA